ncbi:hypothetical protein LOCC1_G007258 [Lachnellula occidentalis]|uniref:Uncharacterized protein n=1 Tax=Lachnellula occidentalis TaxID=215460 RepID=A0A8H8UAM7_9HELO|nr:hypothetical protein LOCC1_G007258 [Lachnellula occidentalis]
MAFGTITVYCGVAAIAIFLLRRLYLRLAHTASEHRSQLKLRNDSTSQEKIDVAKAYEITPLADFDWRAKEPLKFRSFKPKYHLTMGISNVSLSELIEMDHNYMSRMKLRKQIIEDHHDTVIQACPAITPALDELYTWLTGSYLPTRFPSMFKLSPTHLLNLVTSEPLPLQPPIDPIHTLELLGKNLDDDFLLLLPCDGDQYELKGFITCFPSGFNTKDKFGMTLKDIHTPVPGYKEKLERSMDRFFSRLEVGRVVQRSNWAITTHGRLFAASGTHLYEGEAPEPEDIDTFLRCERQLLHRLPKSKALVFSFKTYLYPLSDIKNEGLGENLAQAIDGLKEGSVPAMHFYKRGVVWGDAVKAYLRAE